MIRLSISKGLCLGNVLGRDLADTKINIPILCIDVGGTLCKVAIRANALQSGILNTESRYCARGGDSPCPFCIALLHRPRVALKDGTLWTELRDLKIQIKGQQVVVTGGGAYAMSAVISMQVKWQGGHVRRMDELTSMARGMITLIAAHCPEQVIVRYADRSMAELSNRGGEDILVINVGSGVSFLHLQPNGEYQRVSGTNIGGGTALGLGSMLLDVRSFRELMDLSSGGSSRLDLTIGDIQSKGLSLRHDQPDLIGASFGKLYELSVASNKARRLIRRKLLSDKTATWGNRGNSDEDLNEPLIWNDSDDSSESSFHSNEAQLRCDVAYSIVKMISYNLGYLAYLISGAINVKRLIFTGKYISAHPLTIESLRFCIEYCTEHYPSARRRPTNFKREVLFLEHDGYLGAVGCTDPDLQFSSNLTSVY